MAQFTVNIPTIKELVAVHRAAMETPDGRHYIEIHPPLSPYGQLIHALNTGDREAADKLMEAQGWNGSTAPWSDGRALIDTACENNGEPLDHVNLYDYLTTRDPGCVFAKKPDGGNMLHSWVFYAAHIPVLLDLLERGVDPTERNNDGKTPLDLFRQRREDGYNYVFPSPTTYPQLRPVDDQLIEAIFEQAIAKRRGEAPGPHAARAAATGASQARSGPGQ